MKTLFFVGNVRSGTSLMVRLLNEHPKIYASHESDICWILYQLHKYGNLKHKNFGGHKAYNYTVKYFGRYIDQNKTIRENFKRVQKKLMRKGSLWLKPMKKKPEIICDKTPNNFVVDADFVEFMQIFFPEAIYIHLVRHPRDFVASIARRRKDYLYFGKNDKEVLDWWVMAENRVMLLKSKLLIHTIKYTDLCEKTQLTMNDIFDLFNLDKLKMKSLKPKVHDYKVKLTPEAKEIVKIYGL